MSLNFMKKISQIKITAKKQSAILEIVNGFENFHVVNPGRNMTMDIHLRYYFLDHKKDFDADGRTQIVDNVYTLLRYKGYLNAIASRTSSYSPDQINWAARFKAFQSPDFADQFDNESIPEHARCSVPKDLFDMYVKSHGGEKAHEICKVSLEKPMLTIRANTLKTTRKDLLSTLMNKYNFGVTTCKFAPNGIRFYQTPTTSLFTL